MKSNLALFRLKKKKTMKEMALLLGVSLSYYSKIEWNERNPSYNFINKFKEIYPNVDGDKIFFANTTHE